MYGHKEDVLSVAQCPPNLLATASYDGEVIVWNMVSGHIFCHLQAPFTDDECDEEDARTYGFVSFTQYLVVSLRMFLKAKI